MKPGLKYDLATMAAPLVILFILSPPAAIILGAFAAIAIADNYWDGTYDNDTCVRTRDKQR